MNKSQEGWVWMPHPGHLCVGASCQFVLNTYVPGGYIISTVGEYLPDENVLRIFLECKIRYSNSFLKDESEKSKRILRLKGDEFKNAYLEEFGYKEVGCDRTYETMVFEATRNKDPKSQCCPYLIDWDKTQGRVDSDGYNDPVDAINGHYELCYKWSNE